MAKNISYQCTLTFQSRKVLALHYWLCFSAIISLIQPSIWSIFLYQARLCASLWKNIFYSLISSSDGRMKLTMASSPGEEQIGRMWTNLGWCTVWSQSGEACCLALWPQYHDWTFYLDYSSYTLFILTNVIETDQWFDLLSPKLFFINVYICIIYILCCFS